MGVEPPLQESLRGRHRVVLRPRGRSRFVVVGFLSVWLVGWAAGEVFAVGTLLRLLPPQESAPPALFLGLWLTLWTVGGLGALAALLQQVLGREELEWSSERLTVKRRFRQDVALHRDELDDLVLTGRELTLSARTRTGTVPLVTLGTRQERTELRDELRRVLDLGHRVVAAVPPGWREVQDSTGRLVLEASRGPTLIGGGVLWLLSAWPALKAVRAVRGDAALDALLWTLVVLLALGAGLAALLSRRELLMAPGRLTLRKSGLRSSPSRSRASRCESRPTATATSGSRWWPSARPASSSSCDGRTTPRPLSSSAAGSRSRRAHGSHSRLSWSPVSAWPRRPRRPAPEPSSEPAARPASARAINRR